MSRRRRSAPQGRGPGFGSGSMARTCHAAAAGEGRGPGFASGATRPQKNRLVMGHAAITQRPVHHNLPVTSPHASWATQALTRRYSTTSSRPCSAAAESGKPCPAMTGHPASTSSRTTCAWGRRRSQGFRAWGSRPAHEFARSPPLAPLWSASEGDFPAPGPGLGSRVRARVARGVGARAPRGGPPGTR